MNMQKFAWPYENEVGMEETIESDVLVLGGGLSGCFAAIAAARKGLSVTLVEKGAAERSGSAGTGFDHWESACTNPCSGVTPEEIAEAYVNEQDWYSNGIAHYIECREGYDRLLDLESFGGKIRDTEDEFKGAQFRDDATKLMFAYDYKNKFTIRVWGSTFKPALVKEMKRLGVRILDRTEATALLVEEKNTERRGIGATGMDVHTGKFYIFRAKATVLAMSRPARVWLFNADTTGLCEFRPMQSIGSGHAMGFRAGVEFTMMEKSVRAEFSAAGRSFPPYGAGNNHNTWYAATMVDARGVEIPYVDRDGKELKTVSERYYPAPGQKFFLKGGVIDNPKYEYRGPETIDFEELMKRGYQLPFYADLSRMPDAERRVIWGMMVGEEAKTKIPVFQNYTERGFDPEKHMLQSYGTGWQSANFLEQERQFFGAPGGIMHDWDLKTNIDGIYAAGDQLYASDCAGFACATGYYAGRKASDYAKTVGYGAVNREEVEAEKKRLYAPLFTDLKDGMSWKELNMAISKAMQNYCGGVKCEALLQEGLDLLAGFEREAVPRLTASNPHDLMRIHEVLDILTVAQLVLHASLARKSSSAPLFFRRSDYPEMDPLCDRKHIVIRLEDGCVKTREVPLDFFGKLKDEYEKRNQDYIRELEAGAGKRAAEGQCADPEKIAAAAGRCAEAEKTVSAAGWYAEAEKTVSAAGRCAKAEKTVSAAGWYAEAEKIVSAAGWYAEAEKIVSAAGRCAEAEKIVSAEGQCAEPEKSAGEKECGCRSREAAKESGPHDCLDEESMPESEWRECPDGETAEGQNRSRKFQADLTAAFVPCSTMPLKYDDSLCIGCSRCASVCQCDILLPSAEKGKHPVVVYPGECYYCGACVMVCPKPGAIRLSHPLMNQAKFVPVKGSV